MSIGIPEIVERPAGMNSIPSASKVLLNNSEPLSKRFRALFLLKSFNNLKAIEEISRAFGDDSCLLKHEVAYVLGQMKNEAALPFLYQALRNLEEDAMVRHEAAEAIGAIGQASSLEVLYEFRQDKARVVRETVELAIDGILNPRETIEVERFEFILTQGILFH